MKNKMNFSSLCLAGIVLLGCGFASAQTQTPPQNPSPEAAATQTQQPNLQTELGLTPDQIQKWRALNQELRPQEVAGNLKVREARRALTEAMEAANPNEELIKQRAKELADAQSAMTQLQALRQARVLQMLTPDQRVKLRTIQQMMRNRNQALRRQEPAPNGLGRQQQLKRNANAPLLTPAQRKALRQQQQKQKP